MGFNAAQMARGMGANVTIFDRSNVVLEKLDNHFQGSVRTQYSTQTTVAQAIRTADLVVGAVLIPGAAAPKLVSRAQLATMQAGSVLVDVAIDQGGCFETSKATTHAEPTYEVDGVVHYCVANMPGGVARTSTYALNNATLPHALRLANLGWKAALASDQHLKAGLNVWNGQITNAEVARDLGYNFTDPDVAIADTALQAAE